jgi:hypothetical protein
MPNMPTTENGGRAALLTVNLFSRHIQECLLKDKTTDSSIASINTTVRPFGIPKFLRSDQDTGLATTTKF